MLISFSSGMLISFFGIYNEFNSIAFIEKLMS